MGSKGMRRATCHECGEVTMVRARELTVSASDERRMASDAGGD